jgi:putative endonuclease
MFQVYILYSEAGQQFYKGSTQNIQERLIRHNRGYEKYTSKFSPWILVWYTHKETRSEAMLLERKLKNLSFLRTIDFILKYSTEVPGSDELLLMQKLSER